MKPADFLKRIMLDASSIPVKTDTTKFNKGSRVLPSHPKHNAKMRKGKFP